MRPTVLLFDIDGTLITTGGVGRKALERAFEERHGRADVCRFPLDGMTDRKIFRLGLQALGVDDSPEAIDSLIALYLQKLEEEVARADVANYRLHEGMRPAVEQALLDARFAVGLGTGNIREGARLKLSRVGIYEHFTFGGFGCDAEDRAELIRIGAERGAAQLQAPLAECRVVVIGDTPKDVAAAKAIGAECVGVGTGSYSPRQLMDAGADAAFRDLSEPGALKTLLG